MLLVINFYIISFAIEQLITEFERILAINSSIHNTFKANFPQMVKGILELARNKKVKNEDKMKAFLSILDERSPEEELLDRSSGKFEPSCGQVEFSIPIWFGFVSQSSMYTCMQCC